MGSVRRCRGVPAPKGEQYRRTQAPDDGCDGSWDRHPGLAAPGPEATDAPGLRATPPGPAVSLVPRWMRSTYRSPVRSSQRTDRQARCGAGARSSSNLCAYRATSLEPEPWLTVSRSRLTAAFRLQSVPMKQTFWLLPGRLAGRPVPSSALDAVRPAHCGLWRGAVGKCWGPIGAGGLAANGIAYACFPLSDWVPPQPGDAELCLRMLPPAYTFVQRQFQFGHQVLVHCAGGNDRTGLFLSYFLVRHTGVTPRAAIAKVRSVRPTALSADGWEAFALQVLSISS